MELTAKTPTTWKTVGAAYAAIMLAYFLARLVVIARARDPYFLGMELPSSVVFQVGCGIAALLSALAGLFTIGVIVDRGSAKQLVISMLSLPLIFILLELTSSRP